MRELNLILSAWTDAGGPDATGVLATVVHVKGSAYRRPGARMLILPNGEHVGTISGGCLETEVCRRAWWFTEGPSAAVKVFDTSSDDDAVWEFGLGCNGVISVLLERVDTENARSLLSFLERNQGAREECVVCHVVQAPAGAEAQVGDRLLVDQHGLLGGTLAGTALCSSLVELAQTAFQGRRSRFVKLGSTGVFVEWIGPPVPVLILGAGHDAVPLVALGVSLGWDVTVADGRPAYARPDRFPGARSVVLLPRSASLEHLEIGPDTVVVVMTHNFPQDIRLVGQLLKLRPRYLGLLGPKTRSEQLMSELGHPFIDMDIHSPVGLDLGADTPEGIALSIASEIQAALNGRSGGMLRHRSGPIHAVEPEPTVRVLAA